MEVEEAVEVVELPVNVTHDLHRRLEPQQHRLLHHHLLSSSNQRHSLLLSDGHWSARARLRDAERANELSGANRHQRAHRVQACGESTAAAAAAALLLMQRQREAAGRVMGQSGVGAPP
jgi:hypothetical protein|tara:strand:+ start:2000 stop:2356 length:357 start_codon:yes stop_codon:yes gene_type:complete